MRKIEGSVKKRKKSTAKGVQENPFYDSYFILRGSQHRQPPSLSSSFFLLLPPSSSFFLFLPLSLFRFAGHFQRRTSQEFATAEFHRSTTSRRSSLLLLFSSFFPAKKILPRVLDYSLAFLIFFLIKINVAIRLKVSFSYFESLESLERKRQRLKRLEVDRFASF